MKQFHFTVLNMRENKLLQSLIHKNVYLLFSTVDKLVLIGAFKARLHTSVFPQLIGMVVELLQYSNMITCTE